MTERPALDRIAAALERLAPPAPATVDLTAHLAWHWTEDALHPGAMQPLPLALLTGIDRQRDSFFENLRRHASGAAAHDCLLWGSRGTGKSALVKAAVAALAANGLPVRLIEADSEALTTLPRLHDLLRGWPDERILLFIDDIGFAPGDPAARRVRSLLDGGVAARPANVRLAVTSNRRAILQRRRSTEDDAQNARDEADDALALADRFGLKLGFQVGNQDGWLAMVARYAAHYALPFDSADAAAFARERGGQSGRVAWHYVVELAGREGRALV